MRTDSSRRPLEIVFVETESKVYQATARLLFVRRCQSRQVAANLTKALEATWHIGAASPCASLDVHDDCTADQPIKVVGPTLHDRAPSLQAIALIVRAHDFLLSVGELALEQIPGMAVGAEDRSPRHTHAMRC